MVDRSNRKSQLQTLKTGMKWLEVGYLYLLIYVFPTIVQWNSNLLLSICEKDGVHLCTFPEGTRSKTGRLLPFKNGAFKMAHKNGSPVIPVSIVSSSKCQPSNWMFPMTPCHSICKVVVHNPIESKGKTEEELAEAVRQAIISGLPEEQRPLD